MLPVLKRLGFAALIGVAIGLAVLGLNWVVSHAPWIIGGPLLSFAALITLVGIGLALLIIVSLFWWIVTGKDIFNPALNWLSRLMR